MFTLDYQKTVEAIKEPRIVAEHGPITMTMIVTNWAVPEKFVPKFTIRNGSNWVSEHGNYYDAFNSFENEVNEQCS